MESNREITPKIASISDADLLRRFLQDKNEEAFAEIVNRHQSLVRGVCRRVLGENAEIDDAFQAAFLALARRPRSVRNAASLSGWLYTVAWRASVRLIKQRRRLSEVSLTSEPSNSNDDTLQHITSQQDMLILDEELNRLPARYRDVLVMTYFSEQSSVQIADQLEVSKGTIDGRIRQARNLLRVRLARRGVAIGALVAAVTLQNSASAAVSQTALVNSTTQMCTEAITGSGKISSELIRLSQLTRPETIMTTSKFIFAGSLLVAAALGTSALVSQATGQDDGATINGIVDSQTDPFKAGQSATAEILPPSKEDSNPFEDKTNEPDFAKAEAQEKPVTTAVEEELVLNGQFLAPARYGVDRTFTPLRPDALPLRRWQESLLDQKIPRLDFPGENSLEEILNTLSAYMSTTHGSDECRLICFPDIAELNAENISSLEDVIIEDIELEGITFRQALNLIFAQTLDPELTYIFEDGVMLITTLAKAESTLVTNVYDINDLLGDFGSSTVSSDKLLESVLKLIRETTSPPAIWNDDDPDHGGSINLVGSKLIVRQTQTVHGMIANTLEMLSQSTSKSE